MCPHDCYDGRRPHDHSPNNTVYHLTLLEDSKPRVGFPGLAMAATALLLDAWGERLLSVLSSSRGPPAFLASSRLPRHQSSQTCCWRESVCHLLLPSPPFCDSDTPPPAYHPHLEIVTSTKALVCTGAWSHVAGGMTRPYLGSMIPPWACSVRL